MKIALARINSYQNWYKFPSKSVQKLYTSVKTVYLVYTWKTKLLRRNNTFLKQKTSRNTLVLIWMSACKGDTSAAKGNIPGKRVR